MTRFHLREALLPGGWRSAVSITVSPDGLIRDVVTESAPHPDAVRLGVVVPGMPNAHSHGFQRAMSGLSERAGEGHDSFWSWRQVMYAFTDALTPEQIEAITALAYCEMVESGFTSVGEFHYLHHGVDGAPYADPGEIAGRVCAAAETVGIGLTLLPVLYRHGGFGGATPSPAQRRFLSDATGFEAIVASSRQHAARLPHARVGIAPHSLRAATVEDIREVLPLADGGPVHIHIAEQSREVEECIAATGTRPASHLLAHHDVDERWCLIHCTHLATEETRELASSGAVVGLCPATEANLGDGVFPAERYLEHGGAIGIGSDSNIRIDLPEEVRLLEYGQRLTEMRRNVLARPGGSTGGGLFEAALAGGARALGQPVGRLEAGARADLVALDEDDPLFAGRSGEKLLDTWLFAGDSRQVREVWVGGRQVVADGRSVRREGVESAYRAAMDDIVNGGLP